MKISFNIDLKTLQGNAAIDDQDRNINIGKILAKCLVSQSKGDPLKLYGWALKLDTCKDVELDNSDKRVLREFVENTEMLTILAKVQILEIIDNAKDE